MLAIKSATRHYKKTRMILRYIKNIEATTAQKQLMKLYLEHLVRRLVFKAIVELRDAIKESQK